MLEMFGKGYGGYIGISIIKDEEKGMKLVVEAVDWRMHSEFDEKELDKLKAVLTEKY